MITGLSWNDVLSQEEMSSQKGKQACFFMAVDPLNIPMLTPRFDWKRATNDSIQIEVEKCTK